MKLYIPDKGDYQYSLLIDVSEVRNVNDTQRVLLDVLSVSLFGNNHGEGHPSAKDSTKKNRNQKYYYSPLMSSWFSSATLQDWKELIEESIQQGVFLFVFKAVKQQYRNVLPSALYDEYEQLFMKAIFFNVNNAQIHRNINKLMAENEIPYVIIKGQASGRYYPKPELRQYGDVDFLVNKEYIECTGYLLENIGLKRSKDMGHKCHIVFYDSNHVVEMHWEPGGIPDGAKGQICRKYLKSIIETATSYDGMMVPDDFHHVIILLLHTAVHVLNTGLGLRHLCDWAVFVDRVDVTKYKSQLQEMGLWRFAELLTQVSVRYLRLRNQAWAMRNVEEHLLEEIIDDFLASGDFGIKDPERINEAKLMTTSAQGNVGNNLGIQLFRMLTEKSHKVMQNRHNVVFFIPFGWCYVTIRHLIRIKNGRRPPIHFQKMIKGAKTRREIYKRFELFE